MTNPFTHHPASVGESYLEHMGQAFSFSGKMLVGALACAAHGIFPFAFTKTGSNVIGSLHERMVSHRVRAPRSCGAPFSGPINPRLTKNTAQ